MKRKRALPVLKIAVSVLIPKLLLFRQISPLSSPLLLKSTSPGALLIIALREEIFSRP